MYLDQDNFFKSIQEEFNKQIRSTNQFTDFSFPYQFDILEFTEDSILNDSCCGFLSALGNFIFLKNKNNFYVQELFAECNYYPEKNNVSNPFVISFCFSKNNKSVELFYIDDSGNYLISRVKYNSEKNVIDIENFLKNSECSDFFSDVLCFILKKVAENVDSIVLNKEELEFLIEQKLLDSYLKLDPEALDLFKINFDRDYYISEAKYFSESKLIVKLLESNKFKFKLIKN